MGRLSYTTHDKSPDAADIRTDVTPQARPFSTFKPAVGLDIPDAPRDNTLMQLGNAMAKFNPALTNTFGQIEDTRTEAEKAAAIEKSRQAQDANVTSLKEAQRLGYLEDGAAPNYLRAFKGNFLKLNAERGHALMQEAYYANGDLRNSDDPNAFQKFAQEWKSKYDETNTVADYTPLEIHDSRYHETLAGSLQQLHGQHIHYRVAEREKAAVSTAGDLIQTRLDEAFDGAVDAPDLAKIGAHINDVFSNPTTGMMQYGGMKGSKANEVLTDSIITKAVSAGDASILDVAEHVKGSNGGTLAKTQAFREKAEVARQKISQSNWMADEHSRTIAKYRGDGTETLEQVEARARQDRAKIEEAYEVQKQHQDQFMEGRTKAKQAEPEVSAIVKLHSLNGDFSSVELQQHMKKLAQIDPDQYKSMTTWLQSSGKHANETGNLQVFTQLRAELSSNPEKFETRKIVQAAAQNQLTAGQVSSLFNEAEESQKLHRSNPALSSPMVNSLRSDLRGAAMKSDQDEYGSGRIASDKATAEFNGLLQAFVKSHKGASEYDIYVEMQKHVEPIARKYNADLNQSLAGQEKHAADKQEREQGIADMQERVGKEVQQLRSQPAQDAERSKLDTQLKAKYPNSKQRAEIIDQLLRKKGVK